MGTVRKVLIAILAVCMAVCAGLALAACNNSYPDFKNPTDNIINPGEENTNNRYSIKVQSEGGLALSGIQVNLKKNGNTVVSGISKSGEIILYAEPDDYVVEVDEKTLPAGYKPLTKEVRTGTERNITVSVPSGIISSTASSSTRYVIGNAVHDFTFTKYYTENDETKSEDYTLSDLISQYKAVVINFFFTACGPCNVEFPYMQKAYEAYKEKVALVALADPSKDSSTAVKNFAARGDGESPYTFHMAVDNAGLHTFFQISGWPTTVVIDRYGLYVYRDSGTNPSESSWRALFERYSSEDYNHGNIDPTPDPGDDVKENIKPTGVTESDYNLMPSQIAPNSTNKVVKFETETNENDAEYNWPWIVQNDSNDTYLTASNSGQDPSFSIIYVELDLAFGDMVSFDYDLKSLDSYDMFIVILDSATPLLQISGDSKGWQTEKNIYIANAAGRHTFSFTYIKYYDSKKAPLSNDYVRIKNISVVNIADIDEAMDIARSVYDEELTPDNIVLNPSDGYYHIANTGNPDYDGALVLIDLWNATPWSMEHTKSYRFEPDDSNGVYDASMYYISYWFFSNVGTKKEDELLTYNYLTSAEQDYLNMHLDIQQFSDNGYLPVNTSIKNILVKFLEKFNAERNKYFYESTECELTDWIEMCYFFQHYNSDDYKHIEKVTDENGKVTEVEGNCSVHDDPIKGMSFMNAYDAIINGANDNSYPNHVIIDKLNNGNGGGGVYFKFTVTKSGVYLFDTDFVVTDEIDPELNLYRQRKLSNGQYEEFPVHFHSISDDMSYDALERSKAIITYDEDGKIVSRDTSNIGELTNAFGYVYLTEGEIIYVQGHLFTSGMRGKFDLSIKYIGESYDWLCAAADGAFVGIIDENGNIVGSKYGGIDVGYDPESGYFRHQLPNGEFGSPVYIDFVHANYFDSNDNSLEDMLTIKDDNGYGFFDLRGLGQRDYTEKMRAYIAKSKEGKQESDELYGLLVADMELVQVISDILEWRAGNGDGYSTGYWKSVACYYQHIGAPENN